MRHKLEEFCFFEEPEMVIGIIYLAVAYQRFIIEPRVTSFHLVIPTYFILPRLHGQASPKSFLFH